MEPSFPGLKWNGKVRSRVHPLSIYLGSPAFSCMFSQLFSALPRKFPTMYLARQDVGTKLAVWEPEEAHNQSKSLPLSCYESWDRISSSYHTLSFAGGLSKFSYVCTNSGATWDPYFLDDFKREHNYYFKTLWLQYLIFENTPIKSTGINFNFLSEQFYFSKGTGILYLVLPFYTGFFVKS